MSISDELREYAHDCCARIDDDIHAIADRIDAAHQKALDEWKAKHGQMWLKGYSECHAELLEGNETLASDLERCGWVRLPVDADGVPIHVGDEMCNTHKDGFMAKRVTGLCLHSGGRWTAQVDEVRLRWHDADKLRHYTPPTVEDVLEEFFGKANLPDGTQTRAELVAEYAAKLRLAGEDE